MPEAGALDAGVRTDKRPGTDIAPTGTADAAPAPTGPWEKPAWAIPDGEIKVHRGPDQQDEKIVIPEEQ